MAKIALKKLGIGALAGFVDIGLEKLDEAVLIEAPFAKPIQTVGRAGLFLAGLGLNYMGKWPEVTETLMIAEEPLLIRSLAKLGGVIADYAETPSREAIELRLRQAGGVAGQIRKARFG